MNKLIHEIIDKFNEPCLDNSYTVITVTGSDKKKFLQGQLTNDIEKLETNSSFHTSYCTHQGKVIVNMQVLMDEDKVLILLPMLRAQYFVDKISKYILMSDVKFNINNEAIILSMIGDIALKTLDKYKVKDTYSFKKINNSSYVVNMSKLYLDQCRVIFFSENKFEEIPYKKTNESYTCLIDLLGLMPRLRQEDIEKFIPQVLNSDKLNTVNYKKGCYTGQEIIARTHYLGNVKKHTYLISFNCTDSEESNIINKDSESVGELIGERFIYNGKVLSHCILRDSCDFEDLLIGCNKIEIISMEDTA
tara:strand:+ start:630 stop:1544 length:915 start_codon:yes stop_codon:yes gene_type:complete